MIARPARLVVGAVTAALGSARRWPVRAQQQARRNAMVAATSCTARRAASDDVLAWFDERDAPPAPPTPVAVHGSLAAPGSAPARRAR